MSSPPQPGLERKIGPLQATAINMTQMCGIGPFVTIPAMVVTFGGHQAMFGRPFGPKDTEGSFAGVAEGTAR